MIHMIGGGGKGGKRVISPSLSNASVDDDTDGNDDRRREAMSPSPEVDLSTPELDATSPGVDEDLIPPTPAGSSFSGRSSLARDGSSGSSPESINLAHNHRGASPPLEGDEREFTQTASSMRMRGMSLDDTNIRQSKEVENNYTEDPSLMQVEETEEEKVKRNSEAAATLFGDDHQQQQQRAQESTLTLLSSPMVRPIGGPMNIGKYLEDVEACESVSGLGDRSFGSMWDIKKPENVDLDELDDLLDDF